MINSYEILPFNFETLDSNFLLINDFGEYHYLNSKDFYLFSSCKLYKQSNTYKDLCSKFFACDKLSNPIINHCATRYRTKFRHIFEPVSLFMLVVTYRCNQQCRYCHATSSDERDTCEKDMSLEVATKTVQAIAKFSTNLIKIEFQGGEPTLNFDIIKHVVSISKDILSDKVVEFVICTNLLHIDSEFIEFVYENNIIISTSIDGDRELHDQNRVTRNSNGTYENVVNNIAKLRKRGVGRISALLTVTKHNLNSLKRVIDSYQFIGFNSIFIREMNPYGKAHNNSEISYSTDEFVSAYLEALEYIFSLNKDGVVFSEEFMSILSRKILTPYSTGFVDLQSPSGYAINSLIVNPNGDVFISDEARMVHRATGDDYFLMGNVINDSTKSWYDDRCASHISSSVLECIPGCSWCAFKPYCGVDPVRMNYSKRSAETHCYKHKKIFRYIFDRVLRDPAKLRILKSWAYCSSDNLDFFQ